MFIVLCNNMPDHFLNRIKTEIDEAEKDHSSKQKQVINQLLLYLVFIILLNFSYQRPMKS